MRKGRQLDPIAGSGPGPALVLLRHGMVASHRGDVSLTPEGVVEAERAGHRLAQTAPEQVALFVGSTRRAQETGRVLLQGLTSERASIAVDGPCVASALRNPDLYLAGHRVDLVSSAAAFAEQVPGLSESDVTAVGFFLGFLNAEDRIGYWLHHPDPPGEDAAAVAARIRAFAESLGDARVRRAELVVGITHSPVLRALALRYLSSDPGEPGHLDGYLLRPAPDRSPALQVSPVRYGDARARSGAPGSGTRS